MAAESSGYSNQVFTSYDRSSTTGLDYANNRTYSSGDGRFTTVDPIGMYAANIGNPQSNNLYAYTQNMPTDFGDPSGLLRGWRCTRATWSYGGHTYPVSDWECTLVFDNSWGGSGGSGGGGDIVGVTLPSDFRTRVEAALSGDCNDFIRKLIAKAVANQNARNEEYNRTVPGGKVKNVTANASDGYDVLRGVTDFVFGTSKLGITAIGTTSGTLGKDAKIDLGPTRYYVTPQAKGFNAQEYWVGTFIGIAIHEIVHLAGDGLTFSDQFLAQAAKDLGENVGDVEKKFNPSDRAVLDYSSKWNKALGKHCPAVK